MLRKIRGKKDAHDFLSLEQMARIGYTNLGERTKTDFWGHGNYVEFIHIKDN